MARAYVRRAIANTEHPGAIALVGALYYIALGHKAIPSYPASP